MKSFPLERIAEVIRGVTFSKAEGSTIFTEGLMPVIRAGSIQKKLHLDRELIWVPTKKIKLHQLIRKNDIIMCTSSGSSDLVGKSAISECDWDGSFGAFCAGIRANEEECNPSYLYHFLNSPAFRNWSKGSSGANIKNIRISELGKFEILLPVLAEQQRIAAILDKADALRRKRQQAIDLADQFLRSVFLEMFGDPVTNPKGWGTRYLGDLIQRGPSNGLYKPAKDYGEGTRILRIDGFYNGSLEDQSKFKRVRISDKEVEKYTLVEKSIIINRVNSREYLGKCALIDALEEPTVFESNMMNFTVDQSVAAPGFIVDQLCTPYVKRQILTSCKDAVNQSSINQQDVKSLELFIPPIEMQAKYLNIVATTRNLIKKMRRLLKEDAALCSSLEQQAFRGEL